MSKSAYYSKLLNDARKGRKPATGFETPEMKHATELSTGKLDSENFGEDVGHGFPGGGARKTAAPWEYAQGALSGLGLLKALLSKGLPVATAKILVTRAGKPGVALTGESLSTMTKEEILKHFGEPAARVEAIMAAPEVNAGLKGADAVARNAKVAAARQAVRAEPELATGIGGRADAAPAPEFDSALVKAKEALNSYPAPKPSAAGPAEVTQIAPGRAPLAAPAAASGKVPAVPGEAPHPAGYSPKDVVNKQKDLLNAYFESKGMPKYAHGGTVECYAKGGTSALGPEIFKKAAHQARDAAPLIPDVWGGPHGLKHVSPEGERLMHQEHIEPDELYHNQHPDRPQLSNEAELLASIADHVHRQYFSAGGVVGKDGEDPDLAPRLPALRGEGTGVPDPRIVGVNTHTVNIDEQIPHPALVAPPLPNKADEAQLQQAAAQESAKEDGPNTLDQIETQRRQDVEDSRPGIGKTLGRALSNAALGFAHQAPVDFAASDKANRDEINAEADRRKGAYIGDPQALAGRDEAVTKSPVSAAFQRLVDSAVGQPGFAAQLNSKQAREAFTLVNQARTGEISLADLRARIADMALRRDRDERKLGIDQQNADTNRMRLDKENGGTHAEAAMKVNQMLAGARGLPDYRNARDAIRNIDSALLMAGKPHLASQEVKLLAGEVAKTATGGAATEALIDQLSAATGKGRLADIQQYFTGEPGDAGYDQIVKKIFLPYLEKLRANNLRTIVGTQREIVEPVRDQVPEIYDNLERDPLYYEKIRNSAADAVQMPSEDGAAPIPKHRDISDLDPEYLPARVR